MEVRNYEHISLRLQWAKPYLRGVRWETYGVIASMIQFKVNWLMLSLFLFMQFHPMNVLKIPSALNDQMRLLNMYILNLCCVYLIRASFVLIYILSSPKTDYLPHIAQKIFKNCIQKV